MDSLDLRGQVGAPLVLDFSYIVIVWQEISIKKYPILIAYLLQILAKSHP